MTHQSGPLHELTFSVDRDVVESFSHWLQAFVTASKNDHRIIDSRVFGASDDTEGRAVWTCQFQISDDRALDELSDDFFAETEIALAQKFHAAVIVRERTLREDAGQDLLSVENPDCRNCGTRLTGQYCGICGQRARNRLISLWQLISEAFGDLLEIDSRLWRTLIPLLARPGQLTRDYLEGRRARYMPPFRTYLVLSLIFFVVAFFDPRDDLGLLFEPEPEPTPEEIAEEEAAATDARKEILDELAKEGIIVGARTPDGRAKTVAEQIADAADERSSGFSIQIDEDEDDCDIDGDGLDEMPQWMQRRLTPERLRQVCERVTADKGKTLKGLVLDNIPIALIVLLPLMALVLKVLYPLSRRYFVEHLLFFVHFHAFFFLILTSEILFARITTLLRVSGTIATLAIVAASFYIPVYLFMAMRRVYGQGRVVTFAKYIALLVAYALGAMLTMLSAMFFALAAV